MTYSDKKVLTLDTQLGGDAGTPGLAQPITLDEVQDILMSNRPEQARRDSLNDIRRTLMARQSADTEAGFDDLIAEVDRALDLLNRTPSGSAAPSVIRNVDEAAS